MSVDTPDVLLESISKRYGEHPAVSDLSLRVEQGEFLALLGPSGCGKSTTLRLIAGLERPNAGSVRVVGRDPASLAPAKRDTKLVFQNYALFPHMTVFDNVAFGPRLRKMPKKELVRRVSEMLEFVGLADRASRRPSELSGGEQQRVAISRALVNEPQVLLLDEPFASLDAKITKTMSLEIKHLQKRVGITFIMVTHDQEEALTMADRVAVMNEGRLEQFGTPEEVYRRPQNVFTAQFVGDINVFDATIVGRNHRTCELRIGDALVRADLVDGVEASGQVKLAVRPEEMVLQQQPPDRENHLPAICEEVIFRGSRRIAGVRLEGTGELAYVEVRGEPVSVGDRVYCCWPAQAATVLLA